MREHAEIGYLVDVQNDFLLPSEQGGRLYVRDLFSGTDPGSQQVVPALRRAAAWMREHCDVVLYSGDFHHVSDEEIDPMSPDAGRGTYPPHCMGLSDDPEERRGAEILAALAPEDPLTLARDASPKDASEVARRAVRERRPVFVQKSRFSVFQGNPAFGALLEALRAELGRPLRFHVAGVARDVCVTQLIDGLREEERDHAVVALTDAMHGLGLESAEETHERWGARGVLLTTLSEIGA